MIKRLRYVRWRDTYSSRYCLVDITAGRPARVYFPRRRHMAPCDMRLKAYPHLHLKTDAKTRKSS